MSILKNVGCWGNESEIEQKKKNQKNHEITY